MPPFYFLLLLITLTTACSSPTPKEEVVASPTIAIASDNSTTLDSILPAPPTPKAVPIPKTCTCPKKSYTKKHREQLTFSAHRQEELQQLVTVWKDSAALPSIHSLALDNFDTIPEELAIFKGVTKIYFRNARGIAGLDRFPKLEELHFFLGKNIPLHTGKWRKKLKVLVAQKTIFEGPESFSSFPNLAIIDFAFAGFKHFPNDLEQMPCLQELKFGAYINGTKTNVLDLSNIDLSQNPCLREAHFHTWTKILTGVPRGMFAPALRRVEVHHGNLTKEEQVELNDVKNILFDRGPV